MKKRFKKDCSLIYILYMRKWPFSSFFKNSLRNDFAIRAFFNSIWDLIPKMITTENKTYVPDLHT